MATVSSPNLVLNSTTSPPRSSSPPLKGFKKVFSSRRRSSEVEHETDVSARGSADSLNLERNLSLTSSRSSPSRDGDSISSGMHKLLPGHSKRQRQKLREAELRALDQEPIQRGRPLETATPPPPKSTGGNRSTSSLLTEGSENDTPPPLVSRNSHTGYFTTSSPLIASTTLGGQPDNLNSNHDVPPSASREAFPVIIEPENIGNGSPSPRSHNLDLNSTPVLSSSPVLFDKADTLRVEQDTRRRSSISKLRGVSPARKFRDVFSRPGKSPRTSPERDSGSRLGMSNVDTSEPTSLAERRLLDNPDKTMPTPLRDTHSAPPSGTASPKRSLAFETVVDVPRTPPSGRLTTPLTQVTPPTPTDLSGGEIVASPQTITDSENHEARGPEKTNAPSESSLTHRRVKSNPSTTHQKSKLSTSMTVPLTPTIEDMNKMSLEKTTPGRSFTPSSGFFSSWVSAAQNAATSITNLTGQNRSRAGTTGSEPSKLKSTDEEDQQKVDQDEIIAAKKKLAVETLGSGNLDFSQLGLDASAEDKNALTSRPDLSNLQKKSDLQRDEAQARVEDMLAKRAVSAAYEVAGDSTPVAEISDPLATVRPSRTFDATTSGTLTPPNGSLFEGEGQTIGRSNSVRSRLAKRRSRGSSIATGQSTIASTIAASTSTLVNPATTPRVTGFTPAPKQRNRTFHQQFRSVPEDDNLIEDYSCALQKEILLAGRIYISEGHICFSSNILGWVTTLIISFEEIVSMERENTAMIIPNAIAIQTLHARHTFRSLLSREATFDLMIGIWKVNHPASFSKSVNGKKFLAEQAQNEAREAQGTKVEDDIPSEDSSDATSGSEDESDHASAHSGAGSSASIAGSEFLDAKTVTRKPSGTNGISPPTTGTVSAAALGDVTATAAVVANAAGAAPDFPGPVTHGPTDCTDASTHYDKVIKDEVIGAPLGKIYSLLYGPQSGVFLKRFLVDECKSLDLELEDDKKGLTNENKSRQYRYIKPLGGAIGPKQTKCITTENLDFFDLDRSVTVTCTTQTPDVPSGSAFSTKTRYCLSWAPGNATRLQMNMQIEWTAKSWLKGPIEKGANDGQQQYGDALVKSLKAALGRSRGATNGSNKASKSKKKKRGEKKSKSDQAEPGTPAKKDWGVFEPLRSTMEPVTNIIGPVFKMEVIVAVLSIMTIVLWFGGHGGSGGRQVGYPGSPFGRVERLAAYEQLWQREESELWDWLEDRAGVNRMVFGGSTGSATVSGRPKDPNKGRQRALKDKNMAVRLQAEKWSRKEMQEAVRVTRERLDEMQRVLEDKVV